MKKTAFTLIFITIFLAHLKAQIDEQLITRFEQFGNEIAINGDWAIAGNMYASRTDNFGTFYPESGAAYIFKRQENGLWQQHSMLTEQCWYTDTGQQHGVFYGQSVDINGDWAVVGAHYDSDDNGSIGPDGVAFVYRYLSETDEWVLHTTLSAGIQVLNNFGFSVSLAGNSIFVGDPDYGAENDNPFLGAVYFFAYYYHTNEWTLVQQISADDGWASGINNTNGYGDRFGYSVAADGELGRLVVGAPWKGVESGNNVFNRKGAVYLYEFIPATASWEKASQLHNPDWNDVSQLGFAVDIADKIAVAGAPGDRMEIDTGEGRIFILNKHSGAWQVHNVVQQAGWEFGDLYGYDVAVAVTERDEVTNEALAYRIIAGAPGDDGENNAEMGKGQLAIYELSIPYALSGPEYFVSANVSAGDEMGNAVALNTGGADCAIGGWKYDAIAGGLREGAVMFYSFAEAFSGIWTGLQNTAWGNPENWDDNEVPNGNTSVVIAAASANMPVVDNLAFCLDLNIQAGATLTLSGNDALLRINGDLTLRGEFLIPEGAGNELARIEVIRETDVLCEKTKILPGGTYHGQVLVDATGSTHRLNLAGDAILNGGLGFPNHLSTRGKLEIGSNHLELHGAVTGNANKLYSNVNSSLSLTGEPPVQVPLSSNVRDLNNLTINNGQGARLSHSSLRVFGALNLLSGNFVIQTAGGGAAGLTLHNSPAGNGNLLVTNNQSTITVAGNNQNIELPSGMATVAQLVVTNPHGASLNNNLHITDFFYAEGQINPNGFQASYGPNCMFWAIADMEISDGLFDPANPPVHIYAEPGVQLYFNATGEIDELLIGGFAAMSHGEGDQETIAAEMQSNRNETVFSIGPQSGIAVNNNLVMNGLLELRSDISGNAAFINNTANQEITARVENYLTDGKWHFVSPPVQGSTASSFYMDGGSSVWMTEYNEQTGNWDYIESLDHPLIPGKGYSVWVDTGRADETAVYEGLLNHGDHLVNLSYSGVDQGWNLVGNPFPSPLDWDIGNWNHNNTTGIIYIWNDGNYLSRNQAAAGTLSNGIIPTGQGFFVQATGPAASITMPANARVLDEQPFYKNSVVYTDALDITVGIEGKKDKTWIGFDQAATNSMDVGLDAQRLDGNDNMPKLYTKIGDKKMSINIMEKLETSKSVPLFFKAAIAGIHTIQFDFVESFENTKIILDDLLSGNQILLKENDLYEFEGHPWDEEKRFRLTFERIVAALSEDKPAQNPLFSITNTNGRLNIAVNEIQGQRKHFQIFSLNGQLLYEAAFTNNQYQVDASGFAGQVVLVKLLTKEATEVIKVKID